MATMATFAELLNHHREQKESHRQSVETVLEARRAEIQKNRDAESSVRLQVIEAELERRRVQKERIERKRRMAQKDRRDRLIYRLSQLVYSYERNGRKIVSYRNKSEALAISKEIAELNAVIQPQHQPRNPVVIRPLYPKGAVDTPPKGGLSKDDLIGEKERLMEFGQKVVEYKGQDCPIIPRLLDQLYRIENKLSSRKYNPVIKRVAKHCYQQV